MDSPSDKNRPGQGLLVFVRVASALCFLSGGLNTASGQYAEIRSRDHDQHIVHDLKNADQMFHEVQWDVHNSVSRRGVAVIWTIDAFESSRGKKSTLADAGLLLQIRKASPKNSWHITKAKDQTNISKGDTSATVSAVCTRFGDATMEVTVVFQTPQASLPAAGTYETRLTGTITAP